MRNETIAKLKAMRLPAFSEAYQKQAENEMEYQSLSIHERLALIVDAEYDSRHNNNIKRLIKNARFANSSAFLGNIEYLPDRHPNRELLESLADNEYPPNPECHSCRRYWLWQNLYLQCAGC